MSVSFSDRKSGFHDATAVSNQTVRLKVTGVDSKGRMFRHSATVLMLDSRDCAFLSEFQPDVDGSVLLEFDYPQADSKQCVSQGRVKSNFPDLGSDFYKIVVELENAQTAKVTPKQAVPQTSVKKPLPVPISPTTSEVHKNEPVTTAPERSSPPKLNVVSQAPINAKHGNSGPAKYGSVEQFPMTQVDDPISAPDSVKSIVTSEIGQEMNRLKSWISGELERDLPAIITLKMEKMIGEALAKQISATYENSSQTWQADMSRQFEVRVGELKSLHTSVESMAKKLFDELTGLHRSARAEFEQEMSSRVAAIIRSFEESIAKSEAKIQESRAAVEVALTRSQTIKQEMDSGLLDLQQALEQMKCAESSGLENIQSQAVARLNACATQFDEQLGKITFDRAGQLSTELEQRVIPYQQRADELMEKLGAVFQLLQNTARIQQEQLTAYSQATAAAFEKEVKSILLRLAGSA